MLIILIPISLLIFIYSVELGTDNRSAIARDLFMNENNQFDYKLLEIRLNEKYGSIDKRKDLKSFITRNGGKCNNNICSLNIYTTFCISQMARIELISESKIKVTSFTDGC